MCVGGGGGGGAAACTGGHKGVQVVRPRSIAEEGV